MRSHLTRGVFQAIVDNRPYIHSQCHRHLALLWPCRNPRRLPFRAVPNRSMFSLPFLPNTDKKQPADNGSKQMIELVHALEQRTQPPPPYILAKAFSKFVQECGENLGVLTQNQARFLLQTYQHLVTKYRDSTGAVGLLHRSENLQNTLVILAQVGCEPDATELLNKLAKTIYEQICLRNEEDGLTGFGPGVLSSYISLLSSTGSPSEALDLLETCWESTLSPEGILPWLDVINGFAMEGRESEIFKIIGKMDRCGIVLDPESHEQIVKLLASGKNMEALRGIYELDLVHGQLPTAFSTANTLAAAAHDGNLDWASELSERLPDTPTPESRDALFLLAAAKAESAGRIEEMLDTMAAKNEEVRNSLTIDSINPVVEYAHRIGRRDLVEEYVGLAKKWGLRANSRTHILQIESRIQNGDLDGAMTLFDTLNPSGLTDQADIDMLNNIIKRLCSSRYAVTDYDAIVSFVDCLIETKGRFDAETLTALCRLFLQHHELEGLSTLLRPIIDQYTPEELLKINEPFVESIHDRKTSAEEAWEVYQLLKLAFPATPVHIRTKIMTSFFDRGRSDLACLVFGHMRQRERGPRRPTALTYAKCFQGIAQCGDASSLHLVHNMLKLDLEVGLTTKVLNGLMLAYAACEMPDEAMTHFREILHSEEGPSEQTLMVFFRVCETYHNGVEEAEKMLDKLKAMDITIDQGIYEAYIEALAGHSAVEKAIEAIGKMEKIVGTGPQITTIGRFYNAIPHQFWKDEVENWAGEKYPKIWNQLDMLLQQDESGTKHFRISRDIDV